MNILCRNRRCTLQDKCSKYTSEPKKEKQLYITFQQVDGRCKEFKSNGSGG